MVPFKVIHPETQKQCNNALKSGKCVSISIQRKAKHKGHDSVTHISIFHSFEIHNYVLQWMEYKLYHFVDDPTGWHRLAH